MNNKNYTATITVDQTPDEVFKAVNNPRGWWSEEIEGDTDKLDAVFYFHYKDRHRTVFKITELVPGKKVVWHVLYNELNFDFVKDRNEWIGNDVVFDITKKGTKTEVTFTQKGLVPEYDCYDLCSNAWGTYIIKSLNDLISKGKGQPEKKE